ncbi:MAG: carboxypeptidase-like regulatory domain-containing protein [Chitinophagaceae bacterium]|nr:carboxypeptidase-like regulatory domain-containing protein [Chitinophagaceae bacterium]
MPEKDKHNKTYSVADIQRYLDRQMSAQERYALEKAALEDPFLAEAIEGYLQHPSSTRLADIEELEKRIQKKAKGKGTLLRSIKIAWSAAAAFLIISGAAVTWYWLTPAENKIAKQDKHELTIEPLQEKQTPADPAAATADTTNTGIPENKITEEGNTTHTNPAPGRLPSALPLSPKPASPGAESYVKKEKISPSAFQENEINSAETRKAAIPEENDRVSRAARELREKPVSAVQSDAKDHISSKIITGKITDNNNQPLPFVNIRIDNTPYNTYSDANGNFKLISGDTSLSADIRSVGFRPQQTTLYATVPVNHITLQPDGRENADLAISGYAMTGAKKRAKDDSKDEPAEAIPADGWSNYDIYLANNIRIPDRGLSNNRGFVDLTFSVDRYGRLSDFKVTHSTCPQCNKEAIRLVKEGPSWKLSDDADAAQVSLTIQF